MTSETLVLLVLILFVALLIARVQIAWCLGLSGAVGLYLLSGIDRTESMLATTPFSSTATYLLAVIPMYILMGMFAMQAQLPQQLFTLANRLLRRLPGGLGISTVVGCAGFAAISGSSAAMSAVMSRLTVGEMRRYGYSARFASGIVAGAGTLGALIPPSIILVIFGVVAEVSIGALLIAGIIPGLLSALMYCIYIAFRARADDALTPEPVSSRVSGEVGPGVERPAAAGAGAATPADGDAPLPWGALPRAALLVTIVAGGVYAGWYTVVESGAIGAVAAFVMMVWQRRRAGLRGVAVVVRDSLAETAATTSMTFAMLVGASIFSYFLTLSGVPRDFAAWVTGFDLPPSVLMGILLLSLIPLGMMLESMSLLLITVPLIAPVAFELGFDGVWLGILFVKLVEIGMLTPPVGVNVYIVAGTSGVRAEETFRGVVPFIVMDLMMAALIFFVPAIALWLPSVMR